MGSRGGGLHHDLRYVEDGGSSSAVNRVGEHEAGLTDRHVPPASPKAPPPRPAPYGAYVGERREDTASLLVRCTWSGCQTWSTIAVVTLPVSNGSPHGTMQRTLKAAFHPSCVKPKYGPSHACQDASSSPSLTRILTRESAAGK